MISFYTPLPVRDYWRVVENLPAYQGFQLCVLWMQNNEHRIVFPEMVFGLDMLVAHGCMILPLVLSSFCYVATWILLCATVFRDTAVSKRDRLLMSLLAGVIALFETSTLVLAVPFLLQWTLMQLAATASLVFLSRVGTAPLKSPLWKAIAAASVATYSSANGLFVWPVLICLGIVSRFQLRHLLLLSMSAFVNVALYFVGYQISTQPNLGKLIAHPAYLLGFFASYVSMPFGGMKAPEFGVSVGVFNLLSAGLCFGLAWHKKVLSSPAATVLFGSYLFTLATAALTAAGRADPTDQSFLAAKAVRYISVPQMNWAVLVLMALWLSTKLGSRRVFSSFCLLFSLGFLVSFIKLDRWLNANAEPFQKVQLAAAGIQNDHFDQDLIRSYVHPDLTLVVRGLSRLRKSKLSVYYLDRGRAADKPPSR